MSNPRLLIIMGLLGLVWAMILMYRSKSLKAVLYCLIDLLLILAASFMLFSVLKSIFLPADSCPLTTPIGWPLAVGGSVLGILILHRYLRRRFPMVISTPDGALVLTDQEILLQKDLIRNIDMAPSTIVVEYCDRNKKALHIRLHPRALGRVYEELQRIL